MKRIPAKRLFLGVIVTATVVVFSCVAAAITLETRSQAAPALSSMVRVNVPSGHGSGVHIGNGLYITAEHVVRNEATYKVVLSDGTVEDAELLWGSLAYDVALLRVSSFDTRPATAHLACAPLVEGEVIFAVGNPFDLGPTTVRGRVAAGVAARGFWKEAVVADMTAGGGMSGGPVFNATNRVRGIVVGGIGQISPLAFIVPSSTICRLMGRVS